MSAGPLTAPAAIFKSGSRLKEDKLSPGSTESPLLRDRPSAALVTGNCRVGDTASTERPPKPALSPKPRPRKGGGARPVSPMKRLSAAEDWPVFLLPALGSWSNKERNGERTAPRSSPQVQGIALPAAAAPPQPAAQTRRRRRRWLGLRLGRTSVTQKPCPQRVAWKRCPTSHGSPALPRSRAALSEDLRRPSPGSRLRGEGGGPGVGRAREAAGEATPGRLFEARLCEVALAPAWPAAASPGAISRAAVEGPAGDKGRTVNPGFGQGLESKPLLIRPPTSPWS